MSRPILVERTAGIGIAAAILTAGLVVGAGAFLGGYLAGESAHQAEPTELAEKTFTVADLEAALTACEIDGAAVDGSSVTLLGGDYPGPSRQCVVAEMDAPSLAQTEFGHISNTPLEGGEYSWSNVHMVWEQTDEGRDVTITVE